MALIRQSISGNIEILGLEQIRRRLLKLPPALQGKISLKALHSGAQITRKRAIQLAPTDTGFLSESIVQYTAKRTKHSYAAQVRIGVSRAKSKKALKQIAFRRTLKRLRGAGGKKSPNTAHYWRFLEFGTSRMERRSFMRPAFAATVSDAAHEIRNQLLEGVDRAVGDRQV